MPLVQPRQLGAGHHATIQQRHRPGVVVGTATLLLLLIKDGAIKLDFNDEIVKGACVTHDGAIVNARAKELVEAASR